MSVFELARIMGTSVRMIEHHYGTLLHGSGDAIRGKLDTYLDRLGQDRATASESENPRTNKTPAFAGVSRGGRYWARTSDPQLVELVLSQLS